jgi:hypothetical protein
MASLLPRGRGWYGRRNRLDHSPFAGTLRRGSATHSKTGSTIGFSIACSGCPHTTTSLHPAGSCDSCKGPGISGFFAFPCPPRNSRSSGHREQKRLCLQPGNRVQGIERIRSLVGASCCRHVNMPPEVEVSSSDRGAAGRKQDLDDPAGFSESFAYLLSTMGRRIPLMRSTILLLGQRPDASSCIGCRVCSPADKRPAGRRLSPSVPPG